MNVQELLNRNLRKEFERELENLRSIFQNDPKQIEIAKEDGAMTWDEAMEKAVIIPIELDVGGKMEMKINHRQSYATKKLYK